MNIVVLHGTPRKDDSTSYSAAYIEFLRHHFPSQPFSVFKIGADIKKLQLRNSEYKDLVEDIRRADGIIWIVPVYSALVPSQVKYFIELLDSDEDTKRILKDKYTAVITTSVNVLDQFAGLYLQAVCEDWGMKYAGTFYGTILPIVDEQYRKNLRGFFDRLFAAIREKRSTQRSFNPLSNTVPLYRRPAQALVARQNGKRIALITDAGGTSGNLSEMIATFCEQSPYEVDIIDLSTAQYSGCLSCVKCGPNLICCIKDGFQELHEQRIRTADALVIASSIRDRYVSADIKNFFDRGFYQNHIPYFKGKPASLIISGNLRENPFVRESITSILELRGAAVIDCISDESEHSETTASLLSQAATNLTDCIDKGIFKAPCFYGVGSQKILRDFTYIAKYPFQKEQSFFKKTLFKSFPQKRIKARFLTSLMMLKSRIFNSDRVYHEYQQGRAATLKRMMIES